jgi:hypothetical protein
VVSCTAFHNGKKIIWNGKIFFLEILFFEFYDGVWLTGLQGRLCFFFILRESGNGDAHGFLFVVKIFF